MSQIALVSTTFADAAEAERIGASMIAERLAACVTVGQPVRSIFRWQGEVDRAHEIPATFKTSGMRARALRDRIHALHSYELPVIETVTVEVAADVAAWVADATA
ncbi:divalent-cation tolerance protein CutA [Sphingomonas donggukensis]|uniref:Divalent-cation tolerance protein CutA n=1 Tax=Sphingomonas donggukensis TaxID=2949093 RepID=A0ABY4U0D7_9SPHN|nr:divalent-cation tolerance protein CutA [Sphingomonas donggukensis]URW76033.1 divalent-cation tolerance protein CutA [Sphingomonas donggukensis]